MSLRVWPAVLLAAAILATSGPWASADRTSSLTSSWLVALGFSEEVAVLLHGVVRKSGPGRVDVTGRVEAGKLHLEVRDDGPGLGNGLTRAKEGIGLSNTRERIARIYGAAGQLLLRSEPGRGVTVQIILPCRA